MKMETYFVEIKYHTDDGREHQLWRQEITGFGSAFAVAEALLRLAHNYPNAHVERVHSKPVRR